MTSKRDASEEPLEEQQECLIRAVNRLVENGHLPPDRVRKSLDAGELAVLASPLDGQAELSPELEQKLEVLIGQAERGIESKKIIVGRHGTVAHEVVWVRILLVGFNAGGRLLIRSLVESVHDTMFEIQHIEHVAEVPQALERSGAQVILVDLCSGGSGGLATLARPELLGSDVPVVTLLNREDEPQALHLGCRDYVVKGQLTSRLIVRTLRTAVERAQLKQELDEARKREHFHATRDSMTGLPNRFKFRDELRLAIEYADRQDDQVAVFFLDLDRFKNINDTLGHSVGDQLLVTTARRLSSALRKSDMVARVGGDEFLIMLQGGDLENLSTHIAGKILDAISEPMIIDGNELTVTSSIGIAIHPQDGADPETLIRNADAALYQAKAHGRDVFEHYSQSMNAVNMRRMQVETRLRKAIDRGELEVYYQPRVDVGTGRIAGAEALARWTDAELGVISPEEFVSVAEEAGFIDRLGKLVMQSACKQLQMWQTDGFVDLKLSVNVSSLQITENVLRESILRILWDTGLDPSSLEIEITESGLMQNPVASAAVLRELAEIGIGVSLDDFGTGFSSLSYLKRFPVDTIKIDQSFVRDILHDEDDASITDAIISIADKLRLHVVAEGVETQAQRDFLLSRGCTEMQGYLFSRPLPATAFLELLKRTI